ncbi:protein FAM151B isoform X2 [Penaeus vannamei]|uniref:protein FAM151B isoform X2 n=1 Tax=Penaeus vannamei TaxID=6689 RepID=UPI00387F4423
MRFPASTPPRNKGNGANLAIFGVARFIRRLNCTVAVHFMVNPYVFICLVISMATVGVKAVDVIDFFPDVGDDLSKITWGHAINDKDLLQSSIDNATIMMLEADVSPRRLIGQSPDDPHIPIMAHPPYETSNLSLEMWIDEVIKANENGKNKGAKLDFKSLSIVKYSLEILRNRTEKITFPLWLNADILKGPVGSSRIPVDADKFLALCTEYFPQATLSVGWTTQYSEEDKPGAYTKEMVEEMVATLEKNNITQPITFPIRAAFVGESLENLEWLLDSIPDSTITIWSSENDKIEVLDLITLRDNVGEDAVYVDLPEDQMKEFEEAKNGGEGNGAVGFQLLPSNTSVWVTTGVAIATALAALYLYD